MGKDNLLFLRRVHGKLYELSAKKKQQYLFNKCFQDPPGDKVYIIGTPEHLNLGDSAIVLAEKAFLVNCGYDKQQIKEITVAEYYNNKRMLKKYIRKNELICFPGGGNMGDQWINEEYFRRNVMKDFKDNPMIVFPQTIYYSHTIMGKQEERESIKYYNEKENLTLIAREKISFDIMRNLYPKAQIFMCPDIVLSATMQFWGVKKVERSEVLLCFRSDPEKALSQQECKKVEDIIVQNFGAFSCTDMISDISVQKSNREECVRRKMQEFSCAKLVITDRLHGMIFAAITGTPCVVLSNYNQKVLGSYEWIKELPYIQYVSSVDEVEDTIKKMLDLDLEDCNFDNRSWIYSFTKLEEIIKEFL